MSTCIGTTIDVSFKSGVSESYAEFERALIDHFHTNAESALSEPRSVVPEGCELLLTSNLSNGSHLCVAKRSGGSCEETQRSFTFDAFIVGVGENRAIDWQIREFRKALKRGGTPLKVRHHPKAELRLYSVSADGVIDGDNAFRLIWKRPSILADLLGRTIIAAAASFLGFLVLIPASLPPVLAALDNPTWLGSAGWMLMTIGITEALNVAYIKARRKAAIDVADVVEVSNAQADASRTARWISDNDDYELNGAHMKEVNSKEANAIFLGKKHASINQVSKGDNIDQGSAR